MTACGNLWAIGFDDMGRAAQVRDDQPGWEKHQLVLLDVAVAVRYSDGFVTLNDEPFPAMIKPHAGTIAHFLAGFTLRATTCAAGVVRCWARLASTRWGSGSATILSERGGGPDQASDFVLFVLTVRGADAILHAIRGLGGRVLKTNVDLGAGEADPVNPGHFGRYGPRQCPLM